jgi:GNAT superfamily N-acetyltransferase
MGPPPALTRCVPTLEEEEFLEERIYEYNRDQVGRDDGRTFAFFLRNERQEIVAGLSGWTWAKACEIRTLWVHPSVRGQGIGRALLESAEQEARARGCTVVLLSSYTFQAPRFYEICGYELAWELNEFPPGHRNCYFVKRFGAPRRGSRRGQKARARAGGREPRPRGAR